MDAQNPIVLSEYGEPQPDLALLREVPPGRLPNPEEVLLLIESSDTTLSYDKNVKLPRYARAGIPEFWIVDLQNDTVEVHASPKDGRYGVVRRYSRGEWPRGRVAFGDRARPGLARRGDPGMSTVEQAVYEDAVAVPSSSPTRQLQQPVSRGL